MKQTPTTLLSEEDKDEPYILRASRIEQRMCCFSCFFFATSPSEMVVRVLFPTIPTRCLFLLASPIFDQMRLKPVPALSFSSVDYRSNRYGYTQNLELEYVLVRFLGSAPLFVCLYLGVSYRNRNIFGALANSCAPAHPSIFNGDVS